MDYRETKIKGVYVIEPKVFTDNRGYFMESFKQQEFEENVCSIDFIQENESKSSKGVLRGLHFQINYPQTKLVRVIRGTVFDVAVDLRSNSSTYGKWFGVELSDDNKKQFLIPRGFAHGFLVLSGFAEFCYKCDDFYHPNDEGGLAWNDPSIGIKWPQIVGKYAGNALAEGYHLLDGAPLIMSQKDQAWLTL